MLQQQTRKETTKKKEHPDHMISHFINVLILRDIRLLLETRNLQVHKKWG